MRAGVIAVDRALAEAYGRPERPLSEADLETRALPLHASVSEHSTALDGLIRTILSQSTTDVNSHRAFARLVQVFPRWEDILVAPVTAVEDAIRSGGLARQKAARIQRILAQLQSERGELSLDFLAALSDEDAWQYLSRFKGVGPKTAACVLLFDLKREVFPVDTHITRVTTRLGWLPPGSSDVKAHEILGKLIPGRLHYSLHINLIHHGRQTCHPHSPACSACVIATSCPRIGLASPL